MGRNPGFSPHPDAFRSSLLDILQRLQFNILDKARDCGSPCSSSSSWRERQNQLSYRKFSAVPKNRENEGSITMRGLPRSLRHLPVPAHPVRFEGRLPADSLCLFPGRHERIAARYGRDLCNPGSIMLPKQNRRVIVKSQSATPSLVKPTITCRPASLNQPRPSASSDV